MKGVVFTVKGVVFIVKCVIPMCHSNREINMYKIRINWIPIYLQGVGFQSTSLIAGFLNLKTAIAWICMYLRPSADSFWLLKS
jgi:hypothetical protein